MRRADRWINLVRFTAALITFAAFAMGLAIYAGYWPGEPQKPEAAPSAFLFMLGFLALSVVLTVIMPRRVPRLSFLLGLFPLLVGWRIAALIGLDWIAYCLVGAFVCFVLLFFIIAIIGLTEPENTLANRAKTTFGAIQLGFIRLYLGLDLVPHFTEKLFAGPGPRAGDIEAFQALGVPNAPQLVVIAGIIELSAAIGVGLGALTRLAAALTVVYLMVATVMGHHFLMGFIWASQGGGWEYPVLWSVLILSFVFGGGRWMSVDEVISEFVLLPRWVKFLMGDTDTHTKTVPGRRHMGRHR